MCWRGAGPGGGPGRLGCRRTRPRSRDPCQGRRRSCPRLRAGSTATGSLRSSCGRQRSGISWLIPRAASRTWFISFTLTISEAPPSLFPSIFISIFPSPSIFPFIFPFPSQNWTPQTPLVTSPLTIPIKFTAHHRSSNTQTPSKTTHSHPCTSTPYFSSGSLPDGCRCYTGSCVIRIDIWVDQSFETPSPGRSGSGWSRSSSGPRSLSWGWCSAGTSGCNRSGLCWTSDPFSGGNAPVRVRKCVGKSSCPEYPRNRPKTLNIKQKSTKNHILLIGRSGTVLKVPLETVRQQHLPDPDQTPPPEIGPDLATNLHLLPIGEPEQPPELLFGLFVAGILLSEHDEVGEFIGFSFGEDWFAS